MSHHVRDTVSTFPRFLHFALPQHKAGIIQLCLRHFSLHRLIANICAFLSLPLSFLSLPFSFFLSAADRGSSGAWTTGRMTWGDVDASSGTRSGPHTLKLRSRLQQSMVGKIVTYYHLIVHFFHTQMQSDM